MLELWKPENFNRPIPNHDHYSMGHIFQCSIQKATKLHETNNHISVLTLFTYYVSIHAMSLFRYGVIGQSEYAIMCKQLQLLDRPSVLYYSRLPLLKWPFTFACVAA